MREQSGEETAPGCEVHAIYYPNRLASPLFILAVCFMQQSVGLLLICMAFVCTRSCLYMQTVYMHVCAQCVWKLEVRVGCLSESLSTSVLETGCLTEAEVHLFDCSGWQWTRDTPIFSLPGTEIRGAPRL